MLRQVSLAFLIIPKLAGRMWCPAEEQKAQHRNEATIAPLFPFSHNSPTLGGSVLFKRFKISPAFVVHFGVGGWLWMVESPSARCHTVYNQHFFTALVFLLVISWAGNFHPPTREYSEVALSFPHLHTITYSHTSHYPLEESLAQ